MGPSERRGVLLIHRPPRVGADDRFVDVRSARVVSKHEGATTGHVRTARFAISVAVALRDVFVEAKSVPFSLLVANSLQQVRSLRPKGYRGPCHPPAEV